MSELIDFDQVDFSPTHAVFDIDGTLTNEHSVTSDATVDALVRLAEAMPVIFATGRFLTSTTLLTDRGPIPSWQVCANGAIIAKDGVVERAEFLDPDFVEQALKLGDDLGLINLLFTTSDVYYGMDEKDATAVMKNASEGGAVTFGSLDHVDRSDIVKVGYAHTPERLDDVDATVRAHFPTIVRGHAEFFDLVRPGVTKWSALGHVYEQTGLNPLEGLGVGDTDGDAPWLARMGYPVAAAIATDQVVDACRWQLPNVTDPVARLIDSILRAD